MGENVYPEEPEDEIDEMLKKWAEGEITFLRLSKTLKERGYIEVRKTEGDMPMTIFANKEDLQLPDSLGKLVSSIAESLLGDWWYVKIRDKGYRIKIRIAVKDAEEWIKAYEAVVVLEESYGMEGAR